MDGQGKLNVGRWPAGGSGPYLSDPKVSLLYISLVWGFIRAVVRWSAGRVGTRLRGIEVELPQRIMHIVPLSRNPARIGAQRAAPKLCPKMV